MADRLRIYNAALRLLGEGPLTSLTEDREPRHILDDVYENNGFEYCLEKGLWNFAIRTGRLTYDPDFSPTFGHQYAFEKPSDYVRLNMMATDEYFRAPLLDYRDEGNRWFSDYQTLYISYVSDDNEYGLDLTLWPETFTRYVEAYFAFEIIERLTSNSTSKDELEKKMHRLLLDAKAKNAMNEGTKRPPYGTWVNRRYGSRNRERGPTGGSLTG